jgi:hypothetical protein
MSPIANHAFELVGSGDLMIARTRRHEGRKLGALGRRRPFPRVAGGLSTA